MSRFAAPPQVPSPSATGHAPPSQWPVVIGSIAIAFGAIGAVMSLWGLLSSTLLSSVSAAGMPAGFTMPPELTTFTIVDSLLGLVFAGMLVVGGIATLRRRAGGVRLLRNYAILRLLLVIPLTATQGVLTHRMLEQMVAAMEEAETDAEAGKGAGADPANGDTATSEARSAPAAAADATGDDAPGDEAADKPARGASPKPAASGRSAAPAATMNQIMTVGAIGGTVCAGVGAAIWPTVLLVLLSRSRRKDEVSAWPKGL